MTPTLFNELTFILKVAGFVWIIITAAGVFACAAILDRLDPDVRKLRGLPPIVSESKQSQP